MNRSDFVAIVAPVAVKVRVDGGVLFPSVSIAQTILETGANIPSYNNLTGYKVGSGRRTPYWDGRSISRNTWEVYDGVRHDNVPGLWRVYDSIEDSLKDQALLFLNNRSRYQRVIDAKTPEQQARALQTSGYATDPQYANKILSILMSGGYKKYDEEAEKAMEALKELQQQLDEMRKKLEALAAEKEPPSWAAPTIRKLQERGWLNDPEGTRTLFRALVVMDRAGLFDKRETD